MINIYVENDVNEISGLVDVSMYINFDDNEYDKVLWFDDWFGLSYVHPLMGSSIVIVEGNSYRMKMKANRTLSKKTYHPIDLTNPHELILKWWRMRIRSHESGS